MLKRLFAILLTLALSAGLLAGCGAKEPDIMDLLDGASVESMTGTMTLDMEMSMSMFGVTSVTTSHTEATVEAVRDASHLKGSTTSATDGESETTSIETYAVAEGDTMKTYSNEGDAGWTVTTSENYSGSVLSWASAAQLLHDLSLDTVGDDYIVNGTMRISDAVELMGGVFDDSGFDFTIEDLPPVEVAYTFDKKTHDLKAIRLDETKAMAKVFEKLVGEALGHEDLFEDDGSNLSITMPKVIVELTDIRCDVDVTIRVPAEALAAEDAA